MVKNRLVFLGTAGGRSMVYSQERRSGGILLELDGKRLLLDPGPGSLVHMQALKLRPDRLDAVLLSHLHIDHSNDANAILDGMENPVLIAEEHCVHRKSDFDEYPVITKYHQKKSRIYAVAAEHVIQLGGVEITATKANHSCPAVGFVFRGSKIIGYTSDGLYYKGQERYFEGCDVLLLNVLIPKGHETINNHMTVDDAIMLLGALKKKPLLSVVTHISGLMVRENVWRQTKIIQEHTGCSIIFADDFMELDLDNPGAAPKILRP